MSDLVWSTDEQPSSNRGRDPKKERRGVQPRRNAHRGSFRSASARTAAAELAAGIRTQCQMRSLPE